MTGAQAAFARRIADWWRIRDDTYTVTWLNHYSAQVALEKKSDHLREFDVVGVDGLFLQRLVGATSRTSADGLIPHLLREIDGANIAVFGSTPEQSSAAAQKLRGLNPTNRVFAVDGYAGLEAIQDDLDGWLSDRRIDVSIVSLGPALQNDYALRIADAQSSGVVLTAGGFIDQFAVGNYYPSWAYSLRLNWLIRLVKEPRRLWRRYTFDALTALAKRNQIREFVLASPGYQRQEAWANVGRD